MTDNFHCDVHVFDAPLGAEIRGIQLGQHVRGEHIVQILRAFDEHHVLVFRDQELDNDRQLEVSEWFGPRYVAPPDLPMLGGIDQPPVIAVSNVVEGGLLGNGMIPGHSDINFVAVPVLGAMLRAVEVPKSGGATSWSNLITAYDELEADMKQRIDGLNSYAINPFAGKAGELGVAGESQKTLAADASKFAHPIARTHPPTGKKSLYIGITNFEIDGLSAAESARILNVLQEHVSQDKYYYTHQWRPGDVVFWDNRCTNHKREAFDNKERRVMYRVQIAGTRPF
ncbi:MAG: TauD/TfdA family dioxygenase [Polyangiaceae bacterium]|nr:TauD/TfdA family dioxygenase [Polyangiaceae bacterium]